MCLHPFDFSSIVHNSQINGGEKKIRKVLCSLLVFTGGEHFWVENMGFDQLQEIVDNSSIIVFVGSWGQVVQFKCSQKQFWPLNPTARTIPQKYTSDISASLVSSSRLWTMILSLSIIFTSLNISQIYIEVPNPFFSSLFSGCVQADFWE